MTQKKNITKPNYKQKLVQNLLLKKQVITKNLNEENLKFNLTSIYKKCILFIIKNIKIIFRLIKKIIFKIINILVNYSKFIYNKYLEKKINYILVKVFKIKKHDPEYKLSFLTVGLKLLLINSSIIIVTLSLMISLATYFFIEEYKIRIQEQNIKITEVIGNNIEYTISSIVKQSRFAKENTRMYQGDIKKDLIFIGVFEYKNGNFEQIQHLANVSFLNRVDISYSKISEIVAKNKDYIKRSRVGMPTLINLIKETGAPILAIAFPEKEAYRTNKMILILCPIKIFMNAFHADTSSLVQTSMVDDRGNLLIHENMEHEETQINNTYNSLVDAMQKSRLRNGQIAFTENSESDNKEYHYLGSYWKSNLGGFSIFATVLEEDAFAEVFNIQRRNIYLMISALNIAILALYLYSRRMVEPIHLLTVAARKITHGNFNIKLGTVAHRSHDEIGLLSKTFELMSRGLQERENLKETLGRIVNKEIAKRSLKKSLELGGGENKKVVIMFTDVRNFTSMSEKMKPNDVLNFLNKYFSVMVNCVSDNLGAVDKFVGDAIMAHWGALQKIQNPIDKAIKCALDMRLALTKFNLDRKLKEKVNIGIGINFGDVVSGQVGSRERLEHTVIGDTVNVASRLEGLTKDYKVDVIISEEVYNKVNNKIKAVPLGTVPVKGKTKKIKIYALLGFLNDPETPKNIEELRIKIGINV